MTRIQRALFSLTDKRGAADFGRALVEGGVEILSTGNTARVLRDSGIDVVDVSEFTGFPEMLDGRVKTLHPKVHGGLLGKRDEPTHLEQMKEHGLKPIDLVVVNLYPFESVTSREGVSLADAIENIDIGGPSMLRSAAKNHQYVSVVVDPDDYPDLVRELSENDFTLSEVTRRRLALKAFQRTAAYDTAIQKFLSGREEFSVPRTDESSPDLEFLDVGEPVPLRYGENPHQSAAYYPLRGATGASVGGARQLSGKELSYNNILDCDAALQLVMEFDRPASVVIKHTNPCGAAVADDLSEAFEKALSGDALSAFGGILAFNREVDESLAETIARPDTFFECVVAPSFDAAAVEVLTTRQKWGKNVRLLAAGVGAPTPSEHEVRRVRGGLLVQQSDGAGVGDVFQTVSEKQPDNALTASLRLAWLVAKHVKSNAIVLVRDEMLVGVGAGQMSRVDSVFMAARKAGERAKGSVMGSDAFFPFRDGVDEAAGAGVIAIVQPGGSRRDEEVIAAANEHGMVMVTTGVRHFRH